MSEYVELVTAKGLEERLAELGQLSEPDMQQAVKELAAALPDIRLVAQWLRNGGAGAMNQGQ